MGVRKKESADKRKEALNIIRKTKRAKLEKFTRENCLMIFE